MKSQDITILAIESSCDETAAAVLRGDITAKQPKFEVLSSVVKSQIALHAKMGGVVPEVAARAHVANILPVTQKALADAGLTLQDIDNFAVTSGPGLIASLIVGVEFTKGLAYACGKKMIPTNHMMGHLYSPFGLTESKVKSRKHALSAVEGSKVKFPMVSLVVSGGHTLLVVQKNEQHYKVIGSTVDDAAGEAFDKVARLLSLPYPGGPEISKLAEKGDPFAIQFPRPMMNSKNYDFSFSGLKTAVLYHIKSLSIKDLALNTKQNIARAFEDAVVDVLVTKTMRAVKEFGAKTVSLSGGVSANKALREQLIVNCKSSRVNCLIPPFRLCTDNAEMIAIAAYFKLRGGYKPVSYAKVKADSSWEI